MKFLSLFIITGLFFLATGCQPVPSDKSIEEILKEAEIKYNLLIDHTPLENDNEVLVFYESNTVVFADYIKQINGKWGLQNRSQFPNYPEE